VTPTPVREAPSRRSGSSRLASLDGLRGVAALVVVVHHAALTLPSLALQNQLPDRSSPAWWLAYTPLHLGWAGGEAVLVFFVLSGLVLALPHLREPRRGTWLPYYLKRAVRLYVPVAVAVVVTGLVVTLVPRVVQPGWSWWMAAHAVQPDAHLLAHDAGLLAGTGWLNSALWSLRYEVFFSLFLPVFVVLARRLGASLWLSVPFALWGIGWAVSAGHELISFMFVFAVGVLLAQRLPTLRAWADRIDRSRRRRLAWLALGLAAPTLLLTEWWLKLLTGDWTLWLPLGRPGGVLGAAVLVFCVLHCRPVRAIAESRPAQWLGTVSFSLYLVHEPLVVSVATMTPPTPRGLLVTLSVGVPLSLGAAMIFFHLVERPSMRLAATVGRSARQLVVRPEPVAVDDVAVRDLPTAAIPATRPVSGPATTRAWRPVLVPPLGEGGPRAGARALPAVLPTAGPVPSHVPVARPAAV
jgi:peptidoglycan/LPS O-acetylase OafA/YrhL